MSRQPDFFIVGAPKCGTTALDHYLAAHPDIFMGRKEMHYFGADLHFGPQFYRRDLPAYLDEFRGATSRRCAGESSVWYLFSERAAAEIKAFNPDARIIIMLREPAAMLYSLYHQFRFDGNEHLPTFEEALAAEDERRLGRRTARLAYFPQGLVYRDTARCSRQVERYLNVFGRDRVQVIIYDDLAKNPGAVYDGVLKFLGVKPISIEGGLQPINGNKRVKTPALRAVLNEPLLRSAVLAIRPWLPRPVFAAFKRRKPGCAS